jgi:hypothetical protein
MGVGLPALVTLFLFLGGDSKEKTPRLDVRALPRMGAPPVTVRLVADLIGGDDLEAWYCPEVAWDFGDGDTSDAAPECPPFAPGTRIARQFTAEHVYSDPGTHDAMVRLKGKGGTLAVRSVRITVAGKTHLTVGTDPRPH